MVDLNQVFTRWSVLKDLLIVIVVEVDCYTCNVDFRSEPFNASHPCLFPENDTRNLEEGKTSCSRKSRFCHGIVTRVNRIFVQIQRTCEEDCQQEYYCTEKGYGIETSECHYCCNNTFRVNGRRYEALSCGVQGYKTGGASLVSQTHLLSLLAYMWLWITIYNCTMQRRITH